ncbi:two-component regulator propeller domain-containing protein [Nibricoccus sp. IMCC34717]|uniref:sensor histidine kinase n=1 Tax=Nibricoccus sp. IMCC34717 TaxID=3034021 RepID=UPI00384F8F4F
MPQRQRRFSFRAWPVLAVFSVACSWATGERADAVAAIGSTLSAPGREYWQEVKGLHTNSVAAILQTRDGFLWIGSYEGLFRYDGYEFKQFDASRVPIWHDSTVTCLTESTDGTLWIGHSRGGISTLKDGRFERRETPAGWSGEKVQAIADDGTGEIWALSSSGRLFSVTKGTVLTLPTATGEVAPQIVRVPAIGFCVLHAGVVYRLEVGVAVPLSLPAEAGLVQGIARAAKGGLWAVAGGKLWRLEGRDWSQIGGVLSIGDRPLSAMLEAADGRLFLATYSSGVLSVDPGATHAQRLYTRGQGLPSEWALCLFEDREHGIWLGLGSRGLQRLIEQKVEMLAPPDAWKGRSILTLCQEKNGGFWVGTEGAGVYLTCDGTDWVSFDGSAGLKNSYVWSLCDTADGLFAGSWIDVMRLHGRTFEPLPNVDLPSAPITALLPARSGGVWIGSSQGLARWHQGHFSWVEPEAQRKLRNIRSILEQDDGVVWVTCNGEGLGRIQNGEVRQFLVGDGLPSDFLHGMAADKDGTLWIGSRNGGLVRFKNGQFRAISVGHGFPSASLSQVEDDGLGFLWVTCREGIFRVSKADLNACADGYASQVNCTVFGLEQGLSTLVCASSQSPSGLRAPDGRLAFAMDNGIALIDARTVRRNTMPPPIAIERVKVGDRVLADDLRPGSRVVIEPGGRQIEIQYASLSLASSAQSRYRYRLEGIDAAWIDAGRETRAVYSYLPPGNYRFRVIAANSDGVWNTEGRSLELRVTPFFWQTLWFQVVGVAVALAGLAWVTWTQARYKLVKRLSDLERAEAISAERSRIAQDMHDDIGASLTQITMMAQARGEGTAGETVLGQIHELSRSIALAFDEIVWAINPKHDNAESLATYLERLVHSTLVAAGIRCRLEIAENMPEWRPGAEVRHSLYLVVKEALANTLRHARATEVTFAISVENGRYRVSLSDNGLGSAAGTSRVGGGSGLTNMRARIAKLGGEITTGPRESGGWSLAISLPVAGRKA